MLDLLKVAVDTVTVVTDSSLAKDVGTTVGTAATTYVLLGLGFVNKFVNDLVQKVVNPFLGKLSPTVQALVAFVFAQLIVFANYKLAPLGFPGLSPDIGALNAGLYGAVIWAVSMGWHGLISKIFPSKPAVTPTP